MVNLKKNIFLLFVVAIILHACEDKKPPKINYPPPVNGEKRRVNKKLNDSLILGKTYLSVYSEIYNRSEDKTSTLTATVSIRNINVKDSVYILSANYYNTHGEIVRTYFGKPIFLIPMETVEIIIEDKDLEGGTGANFVFDWKIKPDIEKPFFEAVMISNSSGHSVSFSTQGKDYEKINNEMK